MQTTSSNDNNNGDVQSTVDAKIQVDLNTLKEKMDLCDSMLHPGDGSPAPSLKNNEALLAVIGFLEACAPRMVVEAAAQGALSEALLMECLQVNDRLLKQLADIDTYAFTETPATTTAASAPKPSMEDGLDDLLMDDSSVKKKTKGKKENNNDHRDPFSGAPLFPTPMAGGKTTGEDDPFHSSSKGGDASADNAEVQGSAPPNDDDFDAFFEERTSST